MKFKTDENLPVAVAVVLREAGFDAQTVSDEALMGAPDETVAGRAGQERRILVTLDLDFANVQAYPPSRHQGIIVLRPRKQDIMTIVSDVRKLLAVLQQRSPLGELWIVESDRVRFRR